MTTLPKLSDNNVNYVLETVEQVVKNSHDRRAGSTGEAQVRHILHNELIKYCDETNEQGFSTHPGVGTALQKALSIMLIVSVILYSLSLGGGYIAPVTLSLIINLVVFAVYAHKFLFDGTALDVIKPKKKSADVIGKRYSRGATQNRVVITAHTDAPLSLRSFAFSNIILSVLSICSIAGNTLLFCTQLLYLFAGAPVNSSGFELMQIISVVFIPFYIVSIFIVNPKRTATGVSASLVPCATAISVMKQLFEESIRYEKTEVCCLLTGAEYSSRAGAYAFAKKHKRLFSDVPTVFIPLEEITSSDHLCVIFKDGSGTKGSQQVASVVLQAADNLELKLKNETPIVGTATFTPFSINGFEACSIGTSKKHIAKSMSPVTDKISAVRRRTISDVGSLLLETINYYDG